MRNPFDCFFFCPNDCLIHVQERVLFYSDGLYVSVYNKIICKIANVLYLLVDIWIIKQGMHKRKL